MTVPEGRVGTELYFVTQFHKVTVDENGELVKDKDGNVAGEVVGEVESTQKATDKEFEFDVPFDLKADTLKDKERLVATHVVYEDKEHKKEYAKHFDLTNKKQTITAESTPETPKEKETKSPEEPKETKSLPKTGESIMQGFTIVGITGLILIGAVYYLKKRKGSI